MFNKILIKKVLLFLFIMIFSLTAFTVFTDSGMTAKAAIYDYIFEYDSINEEYVLHDNIDAETYRSATFAPLLNEISDDNPNQTINVNDITIAEPNLVLPQGKYFGSVTFDGIDGNEIQTNSGFIIESGTVIFGDAGVAFNISIPHTDSLSYINYIKVEESAQLIINQVNADITTSGTATNTVFLNNEGNVDITLGIIETTGGMFLNSNSLNIYTGEFTISGSGNLIETLSNSNIYLSDANLSATAANSAIIYNEGTNTSFTADGCIFNASGNNNTILHNEGESAQITVNDCSFNTSGNNNKCIYNKGFESDIDILESIFTVSFANSSAIDNNRKAIISISDSTFNIGGAGITSCIGLLNQSENAEISISNTTITATGNESDCIRTFSGDISISDSTIDSTASSGKAIYLLSMTPLAAAQVNIHEVEASTTISANKIAIYNQCTVNFYGGTIETEAEESNAVVNIGGTFNLDGGEVNVSANTSIAIANSSGTVTVNSGSINASGTETICITNETSGTIVINDGTVTVDTSDGIAIHNSGEITVNGGEIIHNSNNFDSAVSIYNINGTATITGGEITMVNGIGIYNNSEVIISGLTINAPVGIENGINGQLTINEDDDAVEFNCTEGDYNNAIYNSGTGTIEAGSYLNSYDSVIYNDGILNISGGTFTGTENTVIENHNELTITGGTFSNDSDSLVENIAVIINFADSILDIGGGNFTATSNSAAINSGVLTINNGIFTNNTSSDFKGNATIINQSGVMTINGGQITNQSDVYQTRAILNKNTAKLFINQASQEIQTVVKAHTAVENTGTVGDEIEKAVTITGGLLTESVTDDDSMAFITTQGTALVQGGMFEAATGIITDQSGKIVITGGTINSLNYGIYAHGPELTIEGTNENQVIINTKNIDGINCYGETSINYAEIYSEKRGINILVSNEVISLSNTTITINADNSQTIGIRNSGNNEIHIDHCSIIVDGSGTDNACIFNSKGSLYLENCSLECKSPSSYAIDFKDSVVDIQETVITSSVAASIIGHNGVLTLEDDIDRSRNIFINAFSDVMLLGLADGEDYVSNKQNLSSCSIEALNFTDNRSFKVWKDEDEAIISTDNPVIIGETLCFYVYMKDPITITELPTASDIIYSDELSSSVLSGGTAESAEGGALSGTFSWLDSGAKALTEKATVLFTPDNDDYASNIFDIDIQLLPKNLILSCEPLTYDGTAQTFAFTLEGLYGDDEVEVVYSYNQGSNNVTNAGTYAVEIVSDNHPYYEITGDYSFEVLKRNVRVGGNALVKTYGDVDPALTYSVISGSILDGDSITGSLAREAGENVGTYDILQGTLAIDNNNYILQYQEGTFTISAHSSCNIISIETPVGALIEGLNITIDLPNATTSTEVDLTVSDYAAYIISLNDDYTDVLNGALSLDVGDTTIFIKVTAQNGSSIKEYEMIITRLASDEKEVIADNENVAIEDATITVTNISSETFDFDSIFTISENATYKIYSDVLCADELNGDLTLIDGINNFYVRVTAEDGSTQDYILSINNTLPTEPSSGIWMYFVFGSIGLLVLLGGAFILIKYLKTKNKNTQN